MAYRFLPLVAIAVMSIIIMFPHAAYSQLPPGGKYLIQGTGFVAGSNDILDSNFYVQLTTGAQSGSSILSTLDNGLVTINGDNYLNTGSWTATFLRDGRFLLLQGNAQDQRGNAVQVNLFGRQIDSNQNGLIYSVTGKINSTETLRSIYSAKAVIAGQAVTPTPVQQTTSVQNQTTGNVVHISIVPGASNKYNSVFFSPSIASIMPGTTVIWTNNDNVPHRIMSGVASAIRGNDTLPVFSPDGMIDSGTIAPGKSFQYTITAFSSKAYLSSSAAQYLNLPQSQTQGDITFFDPNYTWMVGVISPSSAQEQGKSVQIQIMQGASTAKNNQNSQYLTPASIQVTSGTTIVWVNHDSVAHRILTGQPIQNTATTGGAPPTGLLPPPTFVPDGKIDSGVIAPGQSFQYTITGAGTFSYYDPTNTWLNGNIVVASQASQMPPVHVSILPGSSLSQGSASQQNQYYTNGYYSPDQVQIVPGTTIIWTNNDTVAHSVYSGTATFSMTNPYIPDGRIKSPPIPPGQSYQITVNQTGMIRFYDPTYTWMNGIIVSIPTTGTHIITNAPPTNLITPMLH